MDTMREKIAFINTQTVKLLQPIDLYKAYGTYNFGIYKNLNIINHQKDSLVILLFHYECNIFD